MQKNYCKRSRKNRIFVIASEAKQSKSVRFLRLLRPKGLAMTQKRIVFCINAYKLFFCSMNIRQILREGPAVRCAQKRLCDHNLGTWVNSNINFCRDDFGAHNPRNWMARPQRHIVAPAMAWAKRCAPARGRKFTPALARRTKLSIVPIVTVPNTHVTTVRPKKLF